MHHALITDWLWSLIKIARQCSSIHYLSLRRCQRIKKEHLRNAWFSHHMDIVSNGAISDVLNSRVPQVRWVPLRLVVPFPCHVFKSAILYRILQILSLSLFGEAIQVSSIISGRSLKTKTVLQSECSSPSSYACGFNFTIKMIVQNVAKSETSQAFDDCSSFAALEELCAGGAPFRPEHVSKFLDRSRDAYCLRLMQFPKKICWSHLNGHMCGALDVSALSRRLHISNLWIKTALTVSYMIALTTLP